MPTPRVTLDQWLVFVTVVEAGGFGDAAKRLHRSQSAISYAIAKLQEQLGLQVFRHEGRRAVLTEAGTGLLPRARSVIDHALAVERAAQDMAAGWESDIRLAVDGAYPSEPLMAGLARFAAEGHGTRIRLIEAVMSGVDDALIAGDVDLAIGSEVPEGFVGDFLAEIEFVAVAAADHPLSRAAAPLGRADLRRETQVIVRDSGSRAPRSHSLVGVENAWYVASIETKRSALLAGLGFGWMPRHTIVGDLAAGRLAELPLEAGRYRYGRAHIIYPDAGAVGPATRLLIGFLKEAAADLCGARQ